jgi:hypothetical protein
MSRAILAGTKTQTRRFVTGVEFRGGGGKDGPDWNDPSAWGWADEYGDEWALVKDSGVDHVIRCPYGVPGDRLWVRETWRPRIAHGHGMDACDCDDVWVNYAAGGEGRFISGGDVSAEWTMPKAALRGKNVPGIHMPRWASRITLEVTEVRVQRLQEISEEDAKAEGVFPTAGSRLPTRPHQRAFRILWDSINGKRAPWESNPWVWAVSFRTLAP